jgi:hypothetical protein
VYGVRVAKKSCKISPSICIGDLIDFGIVAQPYNVVSRPAPVVLRALSNFSEHTDHRHIENGCP